MMTLRRQSVVGALFLAEVLILGLSDHPLAQEASESSRKVLSRVDPQYPAVARPMNIQGSVKVDLVVAANGTVKSLAIKGGAPAADPSSSKCHPSVEVGALSSR